jgi:hypothetical protein
MVGQLVQAGAVNITPDGFRALGATSPSSSTSDVIPTATEATLQ